MCRLPEQLTARGLSIHTLVLEHILVSMLLWNEDNFCNCINSNMIHDFFFFFFPADISRISYYAGKTTSFAFSLTFSLFLSEMDFKLIGGNVNLTLIHHLLNVNWVERVLL